MAEDTRELDSEKRLAVLHCVRNHLRCKRVAKNQSELMLDEIEFLETLEIKKYLKAF